MMENTVFMSFAFYSTILILKMYVVAIITGQVRLRKKVSSSFRYLFLPFWLFPWVSVVFLYFFIPVKADKVFLKQVEFSLTEVESKACFIAAADKYLTSLWLFLFVSTICSLMFVISES